MRERFCDSCGTRLQENATFCAECGKRISVTSQTPPPLHRPPAPPPKKSGGKTGLIVVLVVLLLAVAFAVLRFSGVLGEKKPTGGTLVRPTVPETQSVEPEPVQEPVPEAPAAPSATEAPTELDFDWYFRKMDIWAFGETPDNAVFLKAMELAGSWKCLQEIHDYDGTVLAHGYSTAAFAVDGVSLSMTLDWHYMDWLDGTREALDARADEVFTGVFDPPTVVLGTPGNQIDLVFYSLDGKQYAEGIWTVQSGEEVRLLLVRP